MADEEDDGAGDGAGAPFDCTTRLRDNAPLRKSRVRVGCGAGFAGDRPSAALKLLTSVPGMHYLILECLAERTYAERVEAKASGGKGYDPRIGEWMSMLLPTAVEKRVCIITNMGGVDPFGARDQVVALASTLGITVSVAVAYEILSSETGSSTYLGAAPIVHALELGPPNVVITTRVADAALFLAPMVYELGWNWDDFPRLAKGALAGHLLECGCQLTGGYYMHPADPYRTFSETDLLSTSLPYADVFSNGEVILGKAENSGGELSVATCKQQLLYEIGDPSAYITPDVIIDVRSVRFEAVTKDKVMVFGALPHPDKLPKTLLRLNPSECGWKAWGEISYGGSCCLERARVADRVVRSWMEEALPGVGHGILSYLIGKNSLFSSSEQEECIPCQEVRLRMDGLFESHDHAARLVREFTALYTNGPAGGGGISSGCKRDIILGKEFVERAQVLWQVSFQGPVAGHTDTQTRYDDFEDAKLNRDPLFPLLTREPAPSGVRIPLYQVAHGRTGDKGNTLNMSLIPHHPDDIVRLQRVVTVDWLRIAVSHLSSNEPEVTLYTLEGVKAMNLVVKNALDGGVTCSRRVDRHGKTLSDLILSQVVVLD